MAANKTKFTKNCVKLKKLITDKRKKLNFNFSTPIIYQKKKNKHVKKTSKQFWKNHLPSGLFRNPKPAVFGERKF